MTYIITLAIGIIITSGLIFILEHRHKQTREDLKSERRKNNTFQVQLRDNKTRINHLQQLIKYEQNQKGLLKANGDQAHAGWAKALESHKEMRGAIKKLIEVIDALNTKDLSEDQTKILMNTTIRASRVLKRAEAE